MDGKGERCRGVDRWDGKRKMERKGKEGREGGRTEGERDRDGTGKREQGRQDEVIERGKGVMGEGRGGRERGREGEWGEKSHLTA